MRGVYCGQVLTVGDRQYRCVELVGALALHRSVVQCDDETDTVLDLMALIKDAHSGGAS